VDRIIVAAAIGMGLVFVAGVVFGVVLMVAMAIQRQDKRKTHTQEPPEGAAHGIADLNRAGLRHMAPRDAEDVWR
jgi:hypothetical protein